MLTDNVLKHGFVRGKLRLHTAKGNDFRRTRPGSSVLVVCSPSLLFGVEDGVL
jgi:hypothetical protein